MRTHAFCALGLSALLACGEPAAPKSGIDEGVQSFESGDYAAAESALSAALAELSESDAQWERARSYWLRALAHTEPARAAEELVAHAESHSLARDDYAEVAQGALQQRAIEPARAVLQSAWSRYPDQDWVKFLVLDALTEEQAVASPDSALDGLGYGGGTSSRAEQIADPEFLADMRAFLRLDASQG